MARVKRGVAAHARHKKVLKLAKGYRGRAKAAFRVGIEKVEKGLQYAYRDRLGRRLVVQPGDRHVGAVRRQGARDRRPDSLLRPGAQRHPACQFHRHPPCPSRRRPAPCRFRARPACLHGAAGVAISPLLRRPGRIGHCLGRQS